MEAFIFNKIVMYPIGWRRIVLGVKNCIIHWYPLCNSFIFESDVNNTMTDNHLTLNLLFEGRLVLHGRRRIASSQFPLSFGKFIAPKII